MENEKIKVNVSMSGNDYINYIESKKIHLSNKIKIFFKHSWIYFILAIIVTVSGFLIIDIIFKKPYISKDYGMSIIFNIPFPNMLIYFTTVCIGLAWLIHGFGFLLVRR